MPRREKRYHFLYKTTNLLNGKFYVGMHSTDDLDDGYLGSGKRLRYSIRKYGASNFKREIIKFFETRKQLIEYEEKIVDCALLKEELCMNLKPGGSGGSGPGKLNGFFGKTHTEKNRNISKNNLAMLKKRMNEDPIFKREINDKRIKTIKENGYASGFKGKKHNDDTKTLMSLKAQQRLGNRNSQFGTCWITRNKENKKIKKEDLEIYIQQGWMRGRK